MLLRFFKTGKKIIERHDVPRWNEFLSFLYIDTMYNRKAEWILRLIYEKEDERREKETENENKCINEFHNMSNKIFPLMEITIEQLYWRSFQEFIQCFLYPLTATLIAVVIAVILVKYSIHFPVENKRWQVWKISESLIYIFPTIIPINQPHPSRNFSTNVVVLR